jgi:hypothetical protein
MSKPGEMYLQAVTWRGFRLPMSAASRPAGESLWPSFQEPVRNFIGDSKANPVGLLSRETGTGEGERPALEILGPPYRRPPKERGPILGQRSQRKFSEARALERWPSTSTSSASRTGSVEQKSPQKVISYRVTKPRL